MLPDLPGFKKWLYKNILTPAFEQSRLDNAPLLSRIKHFKQFEGKRLSYQTVEGSVRDQSYEKFSQDYQILPEEVVEGGFDHMIDKIKGVGADAASQMEQYSFKVIDETIHEAGNVVQGNGFTKEGFLEMVSKVLIDFDEETGKPKMPSIYIHPNQAEEARKLIEECENDLEHRKKFDAIIEEKRKEWHDREAVRKLVD